jgi:hypothetical protein
MFYSFFSLEYLIVFGSTNEMVVAPLKSQVLATDPTGVIAAQKDGCMHADVAPREPRMTERCTPQNRADLLFSTVFMLH